MVPVVDKVGATIAAAVVSVALFLPAWVGWSLAGLVGAALVAALAREATRQTRSRL